MNIKQNLGEIIMRQKNQNNKRRYNIKLDVIVLSRTQLTSPTPFHTDTHMQKDQHIHIKTNIALSWCNWRMHISENLIYRIVTSWFKVRPFML